MPVLNLFHGDPRAQTLYDRLYEVVYDGTEGLSVPTVLGIFRLLEHQIIEDSVAD